MRSGSVHLTSMVMLPKLLSVVPEDPVVEPLAELSVELLELLLELLGLVELLLKLLELLVDVLLVVLYISLVESELPVLSVSVGYSNESGSMFAWSVSSYRLKK